MSNRLKLRSQIRRAVFDREFAAPLEDMLDALESEVRTDTRDAHAVHDHWLVSELQARIERLTTYIEAIRQVPTETRVRGDLWTAYLDELDSQLDSKK